MSPKKIEIVSPAIAIPPCIRHPHIDYFMYHYIRLNDPHDTPGTQDLSVDPRDFATQMNYVR